jgi:hypothetical protein
MNIKDMKIAFEHSAGEVELIIAGLRKLPMELVQELHDRMIANANNVIQEQIKANTPNPETINDIPPEA